MQPPQKSELSFRPLAPWPATLPTILWKGLKIGGFSSIGSNTPSLEVSDRIENLADALKDCYPELSLSELARLWRALNHLPHPFTETTVWPTLCKHYNLRDGEITTNTFRKLLATSDHFQDWVSRRSVGIRELAILQSLDPIDDFKFILERVAQLDLSRNEGGRCLELACELKLQGWLDNKILTENSWLKHLETLRYPLTQNYDQKRTAELNNIRWPQGVRARWQREGDQSGVEIRIYGDGKKVLQERLNSLQKVIDQIPEEGGSSVR